MPIFCFKCNDCDERFEKLVMFSKINEVICPKCNSPKIEKVWQNSVSLSFKGEGFYKVDYPKSSGADKISE